jgi:tetratricopeptide (TPR) repeat protein
LYNDIVYWKLYCEDIVQVRHMAKQRSRFPNAMKSSTAADGPSELRSKITAARRLHSALATITALTIMSIPAAAAQENSAGISNGITVRGTVRNSDGEAVGDAVVRLESEGSSGVIERKTNEAGGFSFSALLPGRYRLSAEKSGLHSRTAVANARSGGDHEKFDLVLEYPKLAQSESTSSIQTMTFADRPNFTVAGVTDWTAVGGHGSDSSLRTSEALASETRTLKPDNSEENAGVATKDANEGNLHRLAGERAEKSGDALAAVHEYEEAVRLDPSEQNYFEWGSELLLHRGVWQAQEVFQRGVEAHPKSARMLTGLGAALFAGARYDEAAMRLCSAADLNPLDPEPYIFMGKVQIAAPSPLSCVEQKLARFVIQQPAKSIAYYLYAMAILKRQQQSVGPTTQEAEKLLTRAVAIDPKCADAYLQLGILSASQHNFEKAITFYTKAIEANPEQGEAHYRLGVAYDRIGESTKAKQEFNLHDEIEKREAEAIERQRRELKQFVIVPGSTSRPLAP